jgi:hypothetical protein
MNDDLEILKKLLLIEESNGKLWQGHGKIIKLADKICIGNIPQFEISGERDTVNDDKTSNSST